MYDNIIHIGKLYFNLFYMGGFKNHQIDGKEYDFDSDLKKEIKNFGEDGKIDKKENQKLKMILKYNSKRDREKLILENTTREKLETLVKIPGLRNDIIESINIILGFEAKVDKNTKYPSITKPEELLKIFNDKDITIRNINSWKRKGWKSVKVHYESGTQSTRVDDLEKFYNDKFLNKADIDTVESSKEAVSKIENNNGGSKETEEKDSIGEQIKKYNFNKDSNGIKGEQKKPSDILYGNFTTQKEPSIDKSNIIGSKGIDLNNDSLRSKESELDDLLIDKSLTDKLGNFFSKINIFGKNETKIQNEVSYFKVYLAYKNLEKDPKKIKDFQKIMKDVGVYKGDTDGILGSGTKSAFEKYLSLKFPGFTLNKLLKGGDTILKKKSKSLKSAFGSHKKEYEHLFGEGMGYSNMNESQIMKNAVDKTRYTMNSPIESYPDGIEGLLAYIGAIENIKFSYDSLIGYEGQNFPFKRKFGKHMSEFTVNEIIAKQKWFRFNTGVGRKTRSAAAGAYQFIPKTLIMLKNMKAIKGSEKFTNDLQDKAAIALLNQAGLKSFLNGKLSKRNFAHKLSKVWASFPDPRKGGRSHYSGNGIDGSHTTLKKVYKMLDKLKKGNNNLLNDKKIENTNNYELDEPDFLTTEASFFESDKTALNRHLFELYNEFKKGGEKLEEFQTYMKKKGYYNKKIDGLWGSGSKSAFNEFLKTNNTSIIKLEGEFAVQKVKKYRRDKVVSPNIANNSQKYDSFKPGGEYNEIREFEIKNIAELIAKTPRGFKTMMRDFFRKKTANSGERMKNIDIKKTKLIMLMDTKKKEALAYVNGKFIKFPIINTGGSLHNKVWKFNKLNLSNKLLGDASLSGSKTVVGVSFMGKGMNAQHVHGVDKRRLGWGSSRGCVGAGSETLMRIANMLTPYMSLQKTYNRHGKSGKNRWHSVSSKIKQYTITTPMYAYVK